MKKFLVFGVCAFVFALAALLPAPASAIVQAGDLVKLADDGDSDTQHDTAVYYVGDDNRRYVFPSSKVYFTWYANFDEVRVISDTEMASLMIGGNVTYRPGTRLVKITSDPKVYAVEPGGVLRPIDSEEIALALYGTGWNTIIDDVPDAYFVNYASGTPLAAPVYPTGTVVRRISDDAYFYIAGGAKRRLASEEVRQQLRIQDQHVIDVDGDLATYPNGDDILTPEAALTDTSGSNAVPTTAPPRFTVQTPASTFIPVGGNVTLLELHITSGTNVKLTNLPIILSATSDDDRDDDESDDDKGGLVYGNNAQKNFTHLTFVNAAGQEVFGWKDIAQDISQDQEQSFVFTGNLNIAAGQKTVLRLKAQLNLLVPDDEGYQVTVPVAGIRLLNAEGQIATFLPTTDLVGPSLTTLADSLEVSSASALGNKTYVRGSRDVPVTGFSLRATTSAPNVVNSITFQGYIDEGENGGGMLPNTDSDNGTETRVRSMFDAVYLSDDQGTRLAGPASLDVDGRVTFSGLDLYIPAGGVQNIVVHGDVSATVDLELNPNRVAFDIEDAAVDLNVTDETGAPVPATGINPNGGVAPASQLTVREKGEMKFNWTGSGGPVLVGSEVQLGELKLEPLYDDYTLNTLTFRHVGSSKASLGDLRLVYDGPDGEVSLDGSFIGDSAVFNGIDILLLRDATTSIRLFGDIMTRSGGAVYGEVIAVNLNVLGPLVFTSNSTTVQYDESDLNLPEYTLQSNVASSVQVRYSSLTAQLADSSPSGTVWRDAGVDVMQFLLTAGEEGAVRIKKMTFKIAPDETGTDGPDNDALERWADTNGDFADDDDVVSLRRLIIGQSSQLIGEDFSAQIRYSIVSGGTRDTTPAGRDSQSGDYGLIEYVFKDGNEYFMPANGTLLLSFELRTVELAKRPHMGSFLAN